MDSRGTLDVMTNPYDHRPGRPDPAQPNPYSYPSPYWVPQAFHPQGAPAAPAAAPRSRWGIVTGVGLVAAGAAVGVFAATALPPETTAGTGTAATQQVPTQQVPTQQVPTQQVPTQQVPTQVPQQQTPGQGSASNATAAQQRGIVIINTVLGYQQASAAGTGIVLTSDGEVVTNTHVVEGATQITVTVATSGTQYDAEVVGTDPTDDIAVLRLDDASGLTTADLDDTPEPDVGDEITAVGNAGGTGTLTAAAGTVTALEQAITASDDNGQNSERLAGLIEVDAAVVSGDSGGPLYDTDTEVIGINTAASQSRRGANAGYAIPIEDALKVVALIEKGVETKKIQIGNRGLLGVSVGDAASGGATVRSVVDGGAADQAGIVAGDVITSIDGTKTTSAQVLQDTVRSTRAGERVSVVWRTASGETKRATVKLGEGPAA